MRFLEQNKRSIATRGHCEDRGLKVIVHTVALRAFVYQPIGNTAPSSTSRLPSSESIEVVDFEQSDSGIKRLYSSDPHMPCQLILSRYRLRRRPGPLPSRTVPKWRCLVVRPAGLEKS